ncbi:MAG: MBL fold metallo-hydrolase [Solobacterium sp.]|nr:MBL fold metallo-hydrolase [Solobacterium sp.]
MKNQSVFNEMILEEASEFTRLRPFLPYQPDPVISKRPEHQTPRPIEPLKVFDNVYWMGSESVGVLVIDTGDGFMMIDSGSNDSEAAWIAGSFSALGMNPAEIRVIVISHEHFDHYGGVPYFIENICPDALTAISRTGWNLLQTVPTEFAFIEPRPRRADILIDDGLCLKLGNTALYCISTPGHSAGCLSFIFNSSLHGEPLSVGVMGGSAVWPDFPEARMYESSVEYFRLYTDIFRCNAFSAVHQRKNELDRVRDHWSIGTEHPWLCRPEEFDRAYLQGFRDKVQRTIYSGYMQPYMMPVRNGELPEPEGSPLPEKQ